MANKVSAQAMGTRGTPGRLGPLWTYLFRLLPPRLSDYVLQNWSGQRLVIAVPYLWLLIFFLVPFLIVLYISFAGAAPPESKLPYSPVLSWVEDSGLQIKLLFQSYNYLLHDPLYVSAWGYSIKLAAFSTLLCLGIGYPMAYAISKAEPTMRNIFLMLIVLPFWTSFLLRVYAWIGLLKTDGVINQFLQWTGITSEPIGMMNTNFAVYIGIVYSYLPFMILPLYSNLEKHDNTLLEAANDLGAGPIRTFLRVTLPLSMPGIIAGSLLVFIPAVGEYVIPSLLGRTDQLMIATLLSNEFNLNRDWPKASAVAIAMLLVLIVPIMVFQHFQNKELAAAKR
jgi:putrescine transport system permease protein